MDAYKQSKYFDGDNEHNVEFHVSNACMSGHLQIIQDYFESHDINTLLYNGWTPLLYAASCAQAESIDYLIKNGANVNKHKDGYYPLMALCSSSNGTTENRIKCLTLLMNEKANINATNKQRQTALMYACSSQDSEFVEELLKYDRNINACDIRKQTALMYATKANKPDIVKLLIDKGADTMLTDYSNLTAKGIASVKGYEKILSLFMFDEEEEEDVVPINEIHKIRDWKDMFPSLNNINCNTIDFDVYTILHGMGLENYIRNFEGMSLKSFLQLSKDKLCNLNIDIMAHRTQFMEQLHKFHKKKWSIHSIGMINKSLPYTIYDGVVSLGTTSRQVAVIGSSYQYVKNDLSKANDENVHLTSEQIVNFEEVLKKTQKTLSSLKKELVLLKTLSKKIKKENDIGIPPTHIGPKKHNWRLLLSVSIMTIIGMGIFKTVCVQRLINK